MDDLFSSLTFTSEGPQETKNGQPSHKDTQENPLIFTDLRPEHPKKHDLFSLNPDLGRDMPRDTSRRTTSPAQSTTPSGARNRRGSRNTWPFSSPGLPSTPSRDAQALGSRTNNETGLPEENAVTVDSSIKSRKYPPPLPMICWHRANGIPCKGKPGQSSEARHLLWYVLLFSLL